METTIVISKEKYLALKNKIKQISEDLKSSRKAYRSQQSKISKENIVYSWGNTEYSTLWNLESKVKKLKFEARHKLIAYSLIRGKEYGCVENKVREGNEPDWKVIKGIQDECSN